MAERNPIFELHIRPLFRLLDRQHMLRVAPNDLDLWDYDVVKAKSASILQRVKGDGQKQAMPTPKNGRAVAVGMGRSIRSMDSRRVQALVAWHSEEPPANRR